MNHYACVLNSFIYEYTHTQRPHKLLVNANFSTNGFLDIRIEFECVGFTI